MANKDLLSLSLNEFQLNIYQGLSSCSLVSFLHPVYRLGFQCWKSNYCSVKILQWHCKWWTCIVMQPQSVHGIPVVAHILTVTFLLCMCKDFFLSIILLLQENKAVPVFSSYLSVLCDTCVWNRDSIFCS